MDCKCKCLIGNTTFNSFGHEPHVLDLGLRCKQMFGNEAPRCNKDIPIALPKSSNMQVRKFTVCTDLFAVINGAELKEVVCGCQHNI